MPFTPTFPTNLPSFGFPPAAASWFAGVPLNQHFFPPTQSISSVHPLLGGEYGRQPKIIFDLSLHTFRPQYSARNGSHGYQLRLDELSEPAIYPPIHRLKIVCDRLLEWPVIIERRVSSGANSGTVDTTGGFTVDDTPITVYDVLAVIHQTLHTPISRKDWEKLLGDRRRAVLEAYTRRCRRYIGLRWLDEVGGIRRVDYLQDAYMFAGIICESVQNGVAEVRLRLTTQRR